MNHQYRITVEDISPSESGSERSIQFEVENHDDILKIVKWLENRPDFTGDDAKAFGVGLKLFSEVMIKNRNAPLFSNFAPHFMDFMKELKKG